jgi:hypothetical protein
MSGDGRERATVSDGAGSVIVDEAEADVGGGGRGGGMATLGGGGAPNGDGAIAGPGGDGGDGFTVVS